MASFRVFVSCVTSEFQTLRILLADKLRKADIVAKIQEDFHETGSPLLEKLDSFIKDCDAVIHLIGDATGEKPARAQVAEFLRKSPNITEALASRFSGFGIGVMIDGNTPISYTQWEAWLAVVHNRRLYVCVAGDHLQREHQFRSNKDDAVLQREHRLNLSNTGHRLRSYDSSERLCDELVHDILMERINTLERRKSDDPEPIIVAQTQNQAVARSAPTYIGIRVNGSEVDANFLMRWGLYRSSGLVLMRKAQRPHDVWGGVENLERELCRIADQSGKELQHRVWMRATESIIFDQPDSFAHLDAWSRGNMLTPVTLAQISRGASSVGFLVDRIQDLTPATIGRIQSWVNSMIHANSYWRPLVVALHDCAQSAALHIAQNAKEDIECIELTTNFFAPNEAPIPENELRAPEADGILALVKLARREGAPSHRARSITEEIKQRLAIAKVPEIMESTARNPTERAVLQLEAMQIVDAVELADALCRLILPFHPSSASALTRALAASANYALRKVAFAHSVEHPQLMDSCLLSVPEGALASVAAEIISQIPSARWKVAAAWCRNIMRGFSPDASAFHDWIKRNCFELHAVAKTLVPDFSSENLLKQMTTLASTETFAWLRQVSSCFEVPFDEVSPAVRERVDYWKLVQSSSADAAHLRRALLLPKEDRFILGCCSKSESLELVANANQVARMHRLRKESAE